ncbi:PREDICTED: tetraspanin-11-like [Colobus angolensis palliatus]|uniref:tetraspanin-11-like n=1 Tax=Colobus angolensis palliatus TaxID=336983 RepID=UPI0005F38A1F|nr:PREDICTED: tetraspanin-11-like [Colobus angolensis palliatus]
MAHSKTKQDDWLIVCLKYLLLVLNFCFWMSEFCTHIPGAAVLAMGVWTLVERSGYLSILASSTFACILIWAGTLVMVASFLGYSTISQEQKGCLSTVIFLPVTYHLAELVAGVLAHVFTRQLSDEQKQCLSRTLTENYGQARATQIPASVDRLQQEFKCCTAHTCCRGREAASPSYLLLMGAVGIGVACLQPFLVQGYKHHLGKRKSSA